MRRTSGVALAWLACSLIACGGADVGASRVPSPGPWGPAAHAVFGSSTAELLTDGATAAARMSAAVSGAKTTIEAEIYEFNRTDLANAMVAALARGVRVTLIEDPTVNVNAATAARLRKAGAEVHIFPVQPRQIDHVKLLIVDGTGAIFGGMNWGAGSWRNHDFDIALEGPAVRHLEAIFAADLVRSGGRSPMDSPPPDPEGLRLLTTYPEAQVRPAVLDAIAQARASIFIEMYVMTDSEVIAALSDASRRGVAVFILFDPNQDLNQVAAQKLRQVGVHTRFYRTSGEKLHAKAMEVDGRWLIVGSANWSNSGLLHNHELDVVLDSPALASQALARMESDWLASAP